MMGKLIRVDLELVRRKLAGSRKQASELIANGVVYLDGVLVTKTARQMDKAQALIVKAEAQLNPYVSRGAYKLVSALQYLEKSPLGAPQIKNKVCLDAGASTGGFSDVLLRNGASQVYAVDVGYGQLAWPIRQNPRVINMERTNVRKLDPTYFSPPPQLVVADLSFISLTYVIESLAKVAEPKAKFLLMVKPQFEIGKERLGKGGVVRDPQDHIEMVQKVANCALANNLKILATAPSALPGPAGNVEYFLYLAGARYEGPYLNEEEVSQACFSCVNDGPAVNGEIVDKDGGLNDA